MFTTFRKHYDMHNFTTALVESLRRKWPEIVEIVISKRIEPNWDYYPIYQGRISEWLPFFVAIFEQLPSALTISAYKFDSVQNMEGFIHSHDQLKFLNAVANARVNTKTLLIHGNQALILGNASGPDQFNQDIKLPDDMDRITDMTSTFFEGESDYPLTPPSQN